MMKLLGLGVAIAGCTTLGGCLMIDADVTERHWDHDGDGGYERLLGVEFSARNPELTITAPSNGCTQKEQFRADVDDESENRFEVGFRRVVEDRCKAIMPEGQRMTWTYGELGLPPGARVMVLNRISR